MTNETLERNVIDELFWDPKIDNAGIAVSADDGSVTLRGTVGSFRQKREAKRAAERVTLTGTAEWGYQRDEAEFVAANILGVVGVENNVDILSPIPDAGDVHHSIERAIERDAKLDADNIAVSSSSFLPCFRSPPD